MISCPPKQLPMILHFQCFSRPPKNYLCAVSSFHKQLAISQAPPSSQGGFTSSCRHTQHPGEQLWCRLGSDSNHRSSHFPRLTVSFNKKDGLLTRHRAAVRQLRRFSVSWAALLGIQLLETFFLQKHNEISRLGQTKYC